MRRLFAPLLFLALACPVSRGAEATLVRVWPQWHSSESFQSFYEYRTGRELVGGWIVMRSHPEERSGLYFVTRVKNPGPAIPAASFVIRMIYPDSTDTRVFTFPARIPAGKQVFEIGLTGKDWASPRILPVAWELEFRSPDGRLLGKRTSFLWEKIPGR